MLQRCFLVVVRCACLLAISASLSAQTEVKLNELLAKSDAFLLNNNATDWLEIHNTSGQAINLGTAAFTDDSVPANRWEFPLGSRIEANGYLIITFDDTRDKSTSVEPYMNTGFTLRAGGGKLNFYGVGGTVLLESITYGIQAGDFSIGRDATGSWVLNAPSPGAPNTAQALGPQNALKINEWMASPSSGDDWFEIYNPGNLPVALGGLLLTDKVAQPTLSPIPALSFIGTGNSAYVQFLADENVTSGANHANFKLGASGDNIYLFSGGTVIDSVTFGLQREDYSQGRLPDGTSRFVELAAGGSPADANYLLFPGLVVNEVLSHTDPPYEDAVEFYNQTDSPIDISGWYLSNSKNDLRRYRIPINTILAPRGFLVIYEGQFNVPGAVGAFTFNSARGDQVYLAQVDSTGNLTGYRVSEAFEPALNTVAYGRHQTSVPGDYKFVALRRGTFGVKNPDSVEQFRAGRGATNTSPRVGPVVINEIMYNPRSLDGINDNLQDEYIELRNLTPFEIPLFDPAHTTNRWKLRDAVSFTFKANDVIRPFEHILVVSFDPEKATNINSAFRTKFAVPAQTRIFGPYAGVLGNGGDGVELYRPDAPQLPGRPDAGLVPYVRVDKVNYSDTTPWPSGADGTGNSLRRKIGFAFGNDPINWDAAVPTPGKGNYPELEDRDGDWLPTQWEIANNLGPDDFNDGAADSDLDGYPNLYEYAAGTDPQNPQSRLKIDQVIASGSAATVVRFSAGSGASYTVQYRDALRSSSPWRILADIDAQSTAGVVDVQDPDGTTKTERYYRLITPALD